MNKNMYARKDIKLCVGRQSLYNSAGKKDDSRYPKISIITPSYNQSQFLERTILSVLNQKYPNLEYIIIDGGSADGSVDIIRKYEKYLYLWVSEKDNGQYNAINKGLKIATGDILAWQNADDVYLPDTFLKVGKIFKEDPTLDLVFANMYLIDANDNMLREVRFVPFSLDHLIYGGWNVSSQVAFWSRGLMTAVGSFKELPLAGDFDWFVRLGKTGTKVRHIRDFWGCYRIHPDALFSKVSFESRWPTLVAVLKEHGITVSENIPWGKQFRKKRAKILVRQILYYLLQGDLMYMVRAGLKRRHILPR